MFEDDDLAKTISAYRRAGKLPFGTSEFRELIEWAGSRVGWRNHELVGELLKRTTLRILARPQEQSRPPPPEGLAYRSDDRAHEDFRAMMHTLGELELSRIYRAMYYRNELSACPRVRIGYMAAHILSLQPLRTVDRVWIDLDRRDIQLITNILTELPVEEREVANLRYIEGYDFAEIVRERGAAPAVVVLQLYRATRRIVAALRRRSWSSVRSWSCDEQLQWAKRLLAEIVHARQTRGRPNHGLPPPPEWMKVSQLRLLLRRPRPWSPSFLVRLHAAMHRVLSSVRARLVRGRRARSSRTSSSPKKLPKGLQSGP